jgi:hypothetical protein
MKVQGWRTYNLLSRTLLKLLEHPCTTKINLRLSEETKESKEEEEEGRGRGRKKLEETRYPMSTLV